MSLEIDYVLDDYSGKESISKARKQLLEIGGPDVYVLINSYCLYVFSMSELAETLKSVFSKYPHVESFQIVEESKMGTVYCRATMTFEMTARLFAEHHLENVLTQVAFRKGHPSTN